MPSMANIAVMKNDGTTSVTYTALTPSAGDKVAAQWRNEAADTRPGRRPVFTLVTSANGNETGRRFESTFTYPVNVTENGVVKQYLIGPFKCTGFIPNYVESADINEAVSQNGNLLVSTLIKDSLKAGFAPT